ncbi:hypothetical protein EMA8858_01838 [Emticicia aquatica]|uniref:Beta-propeller repeat-containing protein n=1 Tax=Emticicia aquatica TaxID=1681835 RepID=A0ABM9APP0_9BACT|nr:hypothetical protein [Emticicia aquatica]CAH0995713.1 hypothetical protein EMA8858_01838 [Emticicia aquatica]
MKKIILSLFLIFFLKEIRAQNVTILPSGITPVQSAYLKLTNAQILAKTDMAIGDIVYDLTFYCLRMYNGHEWLSFLNAQPNTGEVAAFGFNSVSTTVIGVVHDSQNNIYIAGNFTTSLVLSPTVTLTGSSAFESIFIAKFNTAGTLLSYTKEQGNNSIFVEGLHVDSNDNVYVTGGYLGTISMGGLYNFTSTTGSYDAFFSKYNSSLAIQWSKSEGGTGDDSGRRIATETNGNVFLEGYFDGTINFNGGAVQKTSAGNYDVFLAKYSSTGTFTWAHSFGGTSYDFANDIYYDGSNELYLIGTFGTDFTIGVDAYTSNGGSDFFIAKFDKNGVYLSSLTGGGTGDESGNLIVRDSQGTIFVGGDFQNTITVNGIDYVSKGGIDFFLAELYKPILVNARSTSSEILLTSFKAFGSNDASVNDFIHDATNDSDGNIYITGATSGTLPIEGFSISINNGAFLWKRNHDAKTTGLFAYPTGFGITRDNIGNLFIVGNAFLSMTIGGVFINVPTGTVSDVLLRVRMN